ncbi:hypothetical protein [Prosthecobacter sp.]|uniref:hypothetical protein n=1 Tax=Prosthecobacter sp. TaxID=1965333 RepID=UPI002486DB1B|nr:hypothetical protein [Prosthecobacter sp.]MDI1310559.1 hypothetical protein [Prosthecobacter sp.]
MRDGRKKTQKTQIFLKWELVCFQIQLRRNWTTLRRLRLCIASGSREESLWRVVSSHCLLSGFSATGTRHLGVTMTHRGEYLVAGRVRQQTMQTKYDSPRLERALISPLYHAAKAEGIPMTQLASRWLAEKLDDHRMTRQESSGRVMEEGKR